MKTNVKNLVIAMFTLTIMLGACKKEPLVPVHRNIEKKYSPIDQISPEITSGQWKISSYDDGSDIKPDLMTYLNGYVLKFNSANVVIGTKNKVSTAGKWTHITEGNNKLTVINFGFKPLIMINNEWRVLKESSTQISFQGFKDGLPVYLNLEKVHDGGKPIDSEVSEDIEKPL